MKNTGKQNKRQDVCVYWTLSKKTNILKQMQTQAEQCANACTSTLVSHSNYHHLYLHQTTRSIENTMKIKWIKKKKKKESKNNYTQKHISTHNTTLVAHKNAVSIKQIHIQLNTKNMWKINQELSSVMVLSRKLQKFPVSVHFGFGKKLTLVVGFS